MRILIPALLGTTLLAGCVLPPQTFPQAPPLPAEVVPLPPVSDVPLLWHPGDWLFTGGSYNYVPGHYIQAAGHSHQWVFAHWGAADGVPTWVPGHWL